MKHYIVGAFTPETWASHGRKWLGSAQQHKGKAHILVLQSNDRTVPYDETLDGVVKVVAFDGTPQGLYRELAQREGVYLFAGHNVRFQAEPNEAFEAGADRFVVVPRTGLTKGQPFGGSHPVYENYWAAPFDLIDLLNRFIDTMIGAGCKPSLFDENYVSYFVEYFPWFRHKLTNTEYLPIYDAQNVADYYVEPATMRKLTAVGLDKPETKRPGVIGSVVRLGKPALTTAPEKTIMVGDCQEPSEDDDE